MTLSFLFKQLKAGNAKAITSKLKYEVNEFEKLKKEKQTIGGIFNDNIICIDIDNELSLDIFKTCFPNWQSYCRLITNKGIHFFFKKKHNNQYTKNQLSNLYRGTKCLFIGGFTADFLTNIKKDSSFSENNYSLIYDQNNPNRKIIWGDIPTFPVELFPLVDRYNKRINFDTNIKENRWDYVNEICKKIHNYKNKWAHQKQEVKLYLLNNFARNLCFILGKRTNIPTFSEDFFKKGKTGSKKKEEAEFEEAIILDLENKCTVLFGRVVFMNAKKELEDYIVSKGRLTRKKANLLESLCDIEVKNFPYRSKKLKKGYLFKGGKFILENKFLHNIKIEEFDHKQHKALSYIDFNPNEIDLVKGELIYLNIIKSCDKDTVDNWHLFWKTLLLPYTPKCAFNLIGKVDLGKTTLVENLRNYIKIGFTRKGDSDRFNAKLEGNILTVSDDINLSKTDKRKEKGMIASNVISIERKGKEEVEELYLANRLVIFNEAINVPWGPQDLIKQKYIYLEKPFDFNLINEANLKHLLGYLLHDFFQNQKQESDRLFETQSKLHWVSIKSLLVENADFLLPIYNHEEADPKFGYGKYELYKITQSIKYLHMLDKEQRLITWQAMNENKKEIDLSIISKITSLY